MLVALSVDQRTLTVTAASPLAAGALLRVSVAGLRLAGATTAVCLPGAAGGVDTLLETQYRKSTLLCAPSLP